MTRKDRLQKNIKGLQARGITMVSEFSKARAKGVFRCQNGHEWQAQVCSVFKVNGCRKCGRREFGKKMRLSDAALQERCAKLATRGITMVGQYVTTHTKILFRCANNHEWQTTPARIFRGVGCPRCQDEETSIFYRLSEAEVQNRLLKASERGIKLIGKYTDLKTKTRFRHSCGHEWNTTPNKIFWGRGCPRCADYGFQARKPAILYYVRASNPFGDPVYKIGVTNRTVRERFQYERRPITIVETWHFQNGAEAYEMEQDILKDHDADRYDGRDILKDGNDELFVCDVLQLDKGDQQLELIIPEEDPKRLAKWIKATNSIERGLALLNRGIDRSKLLC